MTAQIIPIGGPNKINNVEDLFEKIKEGNFTACYIVIGEEGDAVYGHTAKTKADLIVMAYEMGKLIEQIINTSDYISVINSTMEEEVIEEGDEGEEE